MKNTKFNATVIDYTHDGKGVVKFENYPIFVKDVLIGEEVEVIITKWKKKYGFGRALSVLKEAPNRITPDCQYYKQCGGCQLQNQNYEEQLNFKTNKIINAFSKQGITLDKLDILPNTNPFNYRNKLSIPLKLDENKKICFGLYQENSNNIIAIDNCLIQEDAINDALSKLSELFNTYKPSVYNKETNQGYVRQIVLRSSKANNSLLLGIVANDKKYLGQLDKLVAAIIKELPNVQTILINHNTTTGNVILGKDSTLVHGEGYIIDQVNKLRFQISLNSFYQVNHDQMINLYQKAIDLAHLNKDDIVLDAYCGVGTISMFIAPYVRNVIGVDIVNSAIINARDNLKINDIDNVKFKCQDVSEYMVNDTHNFNTIFIDPPRKGCTVSFLDAVIKANISKVIYIACDPASQARDVAHLLNNGFVIKDACAVDMFSQTYHVENIIYLERG